MKKKLILATVLISGLIVGGIYANQGQADPVFTPEGVQQELTNHDERLDNHEARLTNVENDVKDIQTNTNTPPSTKKQEVPTVSTPQATPVQDNTVRVVEATQTYEDVEETVDGDMRSPKHRVYYCQLKYSDNTTEKIEQGKSYGSYPTHVDDCSKYIGQAKTT